MVLYFTQDLDCIPLNYFTVVILFIETWTKSWKKEKKET